MLGFTRSIGAEMHSPTDLNVLFSALRERLTSSAFQSVSNDGETKSQGSHCGPAEVGLGIDCLTVPPAGLHTNKIAPTSELVFSQHGEWPSRPDISE